MIKKLFLLPLLFALCAPVFSNTSNSEGTTKMSQRSTMTYEIYPTPQNIAYFAETSTIHKEVNLIMSSDLDDATINKAYDVLSLKEVLARESDTVKPNQTNLILGTYASSLKNYATGNISFIESKMDAYQLEILGDKIVIIGKDTDAVFYGLSTLQLIFEQSNMTLQNLTIKDYSQSKLRGFIEGYYGIPWTSEERQELMRFGSKFKTNIYVYAPKDDVYHSTSWRSLYSKNDFKVLKEQVQTGIATKTKLAWAIHPFMNNPMTRDTFESDLQTIINKFNQVYEAGVRQFVVSADDISMFTPGTKTINVPYHATLHKDLLNALSAWNKSKGDCYDLVFVPTLYNTINEPYEPSEYYQYLMDGLDEDVQIMWTGEKVCSSMERMAFNEFNTLTGGRKPFIWMNWPVNDYAINYLLMGEAEVFNETFEECPFSGLVVNPMQLPEASKLSIFACADYSWNTKAFDMDKSYEDSFKYIEEEEIDAFKKIASHLTSASKFEDKDFKEAEDFKSVVEEFKEASTPAEKESRSYPIFNQCTDVIHACDSFLNNASNKKLIKNIKPWVDSLKHTAHTVELYLDLYLQYNEYDDVVLLEKYNEAVASEEAMNSCMAPNLISGWYEIQDRPAYASRTAMRPFIQYLKDLYIDDVCVRLGIDTGVKYSGFEGIHEGRIEYMTDGNDETYCWFQGSGTNGNYIRFDFVTPTLIKSIEVLGGLDDSSQDYLRGKVQVSNDAKTWADIGELTSYHGLFDLRLDPVTARFVRLLCTTDDTHWVAIREFKINSIPEDAPYQPIVTYSGLAGIYEGALENIVDDDPSTYCWFSSNVSANGYVKIDYRQQITVKSIKIQFGKPGSNDKFVGKLQYSLDGESWTDLTSMDGLNIILDLRDEPITLQYLRMYTDVDQSGWVAITDVMINSIPDSEYKYSVTTMVFSEGDYANLHDGNTSTYVHFSKGEEPYSGASITLDLREVTQINNIIFKQSNATHTSDMFFDFSVYVSSDNNSFTQVGDATYHDVTDLNLDLSSDTISCRYVKIVSNWDLSNWILITEFDVNK